MKTENIISDLIKPLILAGTYKDEEVALKDIIADYIERKIKSYDEIIENMQNKYHDDFPTFTQSIKNKATIELEDDWMEWKGAIEMKEAWLCALRGVINSASETED